MTCETYESEQCNCDPCQCEDWMLKPDYYEREAECH